MITPDPVNKDIVVGGFANGIAPDPYSGASDMKSVGIESIPNEASVAFSTQMVSAATIGSIAVTTSSTVGNTITLASVTGIEDKMGVVFSQSSIANVTVGNVYWLGNLNGNTVQLFSQYGAQTLVTIGNISTATMNPVNVSVPTYFAQDRNIHYYCVDNNGNCWSNTETTNSGKWTFLGNSVVAQGNISGNPGNGVSGKLGTDFSYGNGLVIYGDVGGGTFQYLIVFSNGSIDFMKISSSAGYPWTYGWNPEAGSTENAGPYLHNAPSSGNVLGGAFTSHQAIIGPDNRIYFCNGDDVDKISKTGAGNFDPGTNTTYTGTAFNILPTNDLSQCIAPLGTNYLIGGVNNVVYTWDSTSNLASNYILLSEANIKNIITVNTNSYIFVGNRGRIWITNGSQAQIFKKIPDHISGSIDPLFAWGGACYNWNQLYFGIQAYNNSGTLISNYGGLWAIDLTTQALRNTGQMSYGTYAGNVSALFAENTANLPAGYGLLMGWDATGGGTNGGIDQSVGTPYTGGQSWVTSELIPIGLAINQDTPSQLEFKLSRPLVSGESVQLLVGQYFDASYASFVPCTFSKATSFSTVGAISGITDGLPLNNFQWIIVQAIITSTVSSPSFVRLTEFRIKNALMPITGYSSVQ